MARRLLLVAGVFVVLHLIVILTMGTSPAGSFFGNSLQIAASGIASAMAIGAARRGRGLSRSLWLLVGFAWATWGIANFGWTFYEVVLRVEPPALSFVRFLFDIQGAFFAMALFLDDERDSTRLDFATVLDFLQIAVIYFLIYLVMFYLPSLSLDHHGAMRRVQFIMLVQNGALIGLSVIRAGIARSPSTKALYRNFAIFLAIYCSLAQFTEFVQYLRETPSGTILDLAWSLPLLGGAYWAAKWNPVAVNVPSGPRTRSTARMIFRNVMFALGPLIVMFLTTQLGPGWKPVRVALLAISILCYALRMGINEHRQTANAELVRRQMQAMDSSVDGMAIVDGNGKYAYVNSEYARMCGHESAGAMLGKPWRDVADAGDTARSESEIRESLERRGKWFGELTLRDHGGKVLPVEMAITAMSDGGVVCVCRDLTERVKAEKAQAAAESKYQMIVERVAAISYIAELGMEGRWLYVSPQIENILGYTKEEWLSDSRNWVRFVHPDDHAAVRDAEDSCEKGLAFQAEYRVMKKDGRVVWVSDSAVVIEGPEGRPVMEGIIVDITERKQLEGQLQQSRRMEAVGRLAGGIAHDFNNLLTIIKGYTELAVQRKDLPTPVRADIEHIDDASERAAGLVRQLLAFSRKQVLQPKNLDLNAIVLGLEKLLRRLIGEDIEMKTIVSAGLGTIKADPAQVEQVLMNLVVNARDAMPQGGRMIVETSNVDLDKTYASEHVSVKPGRYVMLAVSDSGTGMSPETIAHIFEPFFTTKGGTKGTGLGLATVYGIVKQSGGYIWVYSEPEKGSTFKVYFPRVDEQAEKDSHKRRDEKAERGSETVLLVEDDDAVRELAEVILKAQGYTVICADGPKQAQEIAEKRADEIDLVLTDVIMPMMSGRELVKKLTARNSKMRVLYMSGYTDNVIAQGGVLEEGLAFLQKPFTPRALRQKVREVLDAGVPTR
ncbi:MAG TPA: PAS domain S-box protein [Candidatus Eremiobacteraceae bacterium]|nr:PAS domain S-box protein [Candidatus Eremiobacteraceae bacterium]